MNELFKEYDNLLNGFFSEYKKSMELISDSLDKISEAYKTQGRIIQNIEEMDNIVKEIKKIKTKNYESDSNCDSD